MVEWEMMSFTSEDDRHCQQAGSISLTLISGDVNEKKIKRYISKWTNWNKRRKKKQIEIKKKRLKPESDK